MARLTVDEIVSEGQLLAGRDDNAEASARWLARWLDSVAASWPWPALQTELRDIALGAGENTLVTSSITPAIKVQRILDNIWLYDSTKTFRRRLRIRHQLSVPADAIEADDVQGTPSTLRIFPLEWGNWQLRFEPKADRDYLLTIPVLAWPEELEGSEVPWYPNDETMVQAVAFKNHEFYDGKNAPVTVAAQQQLAGLVANDRIRFGSTTGVNDQLVLDPTVFRPRR